MSRGTLKGIVEAAYRLSGARTSWLEGLGVAAESALGQSQGTVVLLIDATDIQKPRAIDCTTTRSISNLERLVDAALSGLEPSYVKSSIREGASFAHERDGMEQPGIRMWLDAFGVRDILAVLGMDTTGMGVMLATNLAEPVEMDARRSACVAQLGAHVLSGYRLREAPSAADAAVFRPNGDVVAANDDVREADAVGSLSDVVRALTALGHRGADEVHALDAFTSRVDATWSVVAHVEGRTAEWIVAKRNPSSVLPLPQSLTMRERQVMSLLLMGRTPKVVAYELGIAHATVRVLIGRGLTKMGVKTVEELRVRLPTSLSEKHARRSRGAGRTVA